MTEYNERILKNVLQDIREEQDEELLKEIEEAKCNPLFANKEDEAEAFAVKHAKKQKKKPGKLFLKVASVILVAAVCLTFIPFTVEGRKNSLVEIIVNFVNSEFLALDSNEDDTLLLSYEGEFVPTFIPDGYSLKSVNNAPDMKEITFSSKNNVIVFKELNLDVKINVDYSDADNLQDIEILGYKAKAFTKDGVNRIIITTEKSNIYITCDDNTVDLIGFAELIEKR